MPIKHHEGFMTWKQISNIKFPLKSEKEIQHL